MCGIAGYIGNYATKHAVKILERLEYRGYDSCGFATILDGTIVVEKAEGVVKNIKGLTQKYLKSNITISHTRWATNGKPSKINAHPHIVGKIDIVHNGIIENYNELAEENAFDLISETDSEIIAHLIDSINGTSLLDRVRQATSVLKGSYSIAVLSEDNPDEIVVARNGSPLVVGFVVGGDWEGTAISSDVQGLLEYTNKIYVFEDGEFAVLTADSIRFFDAKNEIVKNPTTVDWSPESISRGSYDTYMRKEIQDQPLAVTNTLIKNDWNAAYEFIDSLSCTDVLFIACGTSFNASKIGVIFLEDTGFVYSRARLASEVCYSTRVKPGTLVIAISQSGETADTLNAVRYVKEAGATVLAIVNTANSSLTREADYVIYTAAGPEISVASTKAFTSQLATLYMLGGIFYGKHTKTGQYMLNKIKTELKNITTHMYEVLDQEQKIKTIASTISNTSVLFLGRGISAPVAYEGALKLKEISYLHAEGLPAGEIKHGPIALIKTDTPVIVLVPKDITYNKMIASIREVQTRGARVIAIASKNDETIANLVDEVIYIPDTSQTLSSILFVLPLQLLAYHVAKKLGRDIDHPRNLAKSVTVE